MEKNMLEEIKVSELEVNPAELFSCQWGTLMAGNKENGYNAMTISWGATGAIWGKEMAATVYVRPQRYTKQFMEREEYFSINFLPEELHHTHKIFGNASGRDIDKFAATGLTPVFDKNTCWIEEAELVFICKKMYAQDMTQENFTDPAVDQKVYPQHDYHTMYIGEVVRILKRK